MSESIALTLLIAAVLGSVVEAQRITWHLQNVEVGGGWYPRAWLAAESRRACESNFVVVGQSAAGGFEPKQSMTGTYQYGTYLFGGPQLAPVIAWNSYSGVSEVENPAVAMALTSTIGTRWWRCIKEGWTMAPRFLIAPRRVRR